MNAVALITGGWQLLRRHTMKSCMNALDRLCVKLVQYKECVIMSDLIKIGGLWKNQDKNGNDYFSGGFTYGTKLLVMSNTFKEKDSEPDFIVYVGKKDKPESEE